MAAAPGGAVVSSRKRMWGGRVAEDTDSLVQEFNASIDVDRELALEDIEGSVAHATMLGEQGILSEDEVHQRVTGRREIEAQIESGNVDRSGEHGELHMQS